MLQALRRFLGLTTVLCLLALPALGEEGSTGLNTAPLTESGFAVFPDDNGVDMVYRSPSQPFLGETDVGEAAAFADIVDLANEGAVCIRFTLSVTCEHALPASAVLLTVGKTDWRFPVRATVNEYDATYYNDVIFCLTDESFSLLTDLAKSDAVAFTLVQAKLTGESMVDTPLCVGTLTLPDGELSALSALYKQCGGLEQDFTFARDAWPFETGRKGSFLP